MEGSTGIEDQSRNRGKDLYPNAVYVDVTFGGGEFHI